MFKNKKIIFIDFTSSCNHNTIRNIPIGASEYQFYNFINILLLNNYNIICYNRTSDNIEIDNMIYTNYENIKYGNIMKNDIIIIQRMFPTDINVLNKIKNNKIYFWIHDLIESKIFLNNNNKYVDFFNKNQIKFKELIKTNFIDKNNINFILNSNFTKMLFTNFINTFKLSINENRIRVIYNILYDEDFLKIKYTNNIEINEYNIIYASAWQKGVWDVIKLFEFILTKDSNYKLILMSPGYDMKGFSEYQKQLITKFQDKIIILGPVNKEEYSKTIKSSLCVLTSKFSETFGCVFAESLFLGTPVIGDINSGAVPEIVGNNYIVNFDNLEQFYNKLLEIKNNRKNLNIKLDDKFTLEPNLKLWLELL